MRRQRRPSRIFSASGQSCVAGSRLLLQERSKRSVPGCQAAQTVIGDPLDDNSQMGPLATEAQLSNIQSTLADATANGRICVTGNTPLGLETGWYIEPTIVDCPHQDISIVRNELCLVRYAWVKDETEASCSPTIQRTGERRLHPDVGRASRQQGDSRRYRSVNTYRWCRPSRLRGLRGQRGYGRIRHGGDL